MNKSESKYHNTACLMNQALLILLETKDFDYITVKEICKKAGVNRSTFYLHYDSMDDLLFESIEYLKNELISKYPNTRQINPKTDSLENLIMITPEYVIPYLQFLKENKKAFVTAVSKPNLFSVENIFNKMYNELFSHLLERYNVSENEKLYRIKFYLNGIHAIVIEWLKNGCKEELSFISNLIYDCVLPQQK